MTTTLSRFLADPAHLRMGRQVLADRYFAAGRYLLTASTLSAGEVEAALVREGWTALDVLRACS